ncbi:hypothetical protein BD413DRAFT_617979 [Trametes elegans]|nr:hypothetical protein BD413DRAFT_617979 [Trametes elegans]
MCFYLFASASVFSIAVLMLINFQGYRASSWIEHSLSKKYFLFLLINVGFIFLLASTYLQLVMDLANSPAKIPEKVAQALHAGKARHFFLSYVILQSLGIMPLQLLNLAIVIQRIFMRIFVARTPQDFAKLNAPPLINYGVPLVVVFGALYFGIGYVVYKYNLLFVLYKPYELSEQAWPITFIRLIWGVVVFQIFMIGLFLLKKAYIISTIMIPLLEFTVIWTWWVDRTRSRRSRNRNFYRRRNAQNDDTLYIAPEDERTDYSQRPMANWYAGVLNTGKHRYGHPALNGVFGTLATFEKSVLSLRKRASVVHRRRSTAAPDVLSGEGANGEPRDDANP